MRILYVCFYNDLNGIQKERILSSAGQDKTEYLIELMVASSLKVDVVSFAYSNSPTEVKDEDVLNDGFKVHYFASKFSKNRIINHLRLIKFKIRALFYLLRNIKENDVVLVYHSLFYMKLINTLKRIKRNTRFLIQAEEIYSIVWYKNKKSIKKEIAYLKRFKNIIVSNDSLAEKLSFPSDAALVLPGNYNYRGKINDFKKDKIDVVYSGNTDPSIYDLYSTIEAFDLLPQNYRLHILCSGSDEEMRALESLSSDRVLIYKELHGSLYSSFLSKCDIGICPRRPNDFNQSSFPSKILTYLRHGLRVVSSNFFTSENELKKYITIYQHNSPTEIANAILSAQTTGMDNAKDYIIAKNKEFSKKLVDFIGEFK